MKDRWSEQRTSSACVWRRRASAAFGCRSRPHLGSVASTPARALELLERTPGLGLARLQPLRLPGHPAGGIDPLVPRAHLPCGARPGVCRRRSGRASSTSSGCMDPPSRAGFEGYVGLEYVWLDWEHCNECDNLAETILLRDRLQAKLAGRAWQYPDLAV